MKRSAILFSICVLGLPLVALSQGEPGFDKMSLGANFELSVPMGDFSDYGSTGYGGNVKYQYGGGTRSAFTATAGYLVWGKKQLPAGTSVEWKAFNIFVGGKWYFAPGFFGSLEGGAYFMTSTYEGYVVGGKGSATYGMLPVGLGYQKSGFEIAARYLLLHPDFNSFSFTVGYNFAL